MTAPRVGGLFAGAGMLDHAVHHTLGATPAWFVENDPAASKVLAHHWPRVPNYGDITRVNWADVEPVDVLCAGFPCQDVSSAGKRVGLRPGTRSGLWSHAAYAISQLKPKLVIIENVRGLLSADADCELEPDPWGLGNRGGRPLRAIGAVLGDLAGLGFDARWCGLRAADVGAPHGRFRVFITAWPATDTESSARRRTQPEHLGAGVGSTTEPGERVSSSTQRAGFVANAAGSGRGQHEPQHVGVNSAEAVRPGETEPGRRDSAVADPAGNGRGEGWPESAGFIGGSDAALGRDGTAPHAHSHPIRQQPECIRRSDDTPLIGKPDAGTWGPYEPAIRRWERTLTRPAPAPTLTGQRGGQQLAPKFVEWLMGLPDGWVTGVPGLSRNDQLKILGNGVVPQQAAAALRLLLGAVVECAA